MALQLEVTTPYGITANYWRIAEEGADCSANNHGKTPYVQRVIRLYANKAASDANAEPVPGYDYVIRLTGQDALDAYTDENYPGDPRHALYEAAKLMTEFTGAVDV